MKIIPFMPLASLPAYHIPPFVCHEQAEDVLSRVERLLGAVTADNVVMFEEGDQVIQLSEGGWFIKPEKKLHWRYHPELFDSTEFEIQNSQWNLQLQQLFDSSCVATVKVSNG